MWVYCMYMLLGATCLSLWHAPQWCIIQLMSLWRVPHVPKQCTLAVIVAKFACVLCGSKWKFTVCADFNFDCRRYFNAVLLHNVSFVCVCVCVCVCVQDSHSRPHRHKDGHHHHHTSASQGSHRHTRYIQLHCTTQHYFCACGVSNVFLATSWVFWLENFMYYICICRVIK